MLTLPTIFNSLQKIGGQAIVGIHKDENIGASVFGTQITLGADVTAGGVENGEFGQFAG